VEAAKRKGLTFKDLADLSEDATYRLVFPERCDICTWYRFTNRSSKIQLSHCVENVTVLPGTDDMDFDYTTSGIFTSVS